MLSLKIFFLVKTPNVLLMFNVIKIRDHIGDMTSSINIILSASNEIDRKIADISSDAGILISVIINQIFL